MPAFVGCDQPAFEIAPHRRDRLSSKIDLPASNLSAPASTISRIRSESKAPQNPKTAFGQIKQSRCLCDEIGLADLQHCFFATKRIQTIGMITVNFGS